MWALMCQKAAVFPALLLFLQNLEKSPPKTKLQFLLDPSAFQEILEIIEIIGQPVLDLISYLTRTFVYYLYRQKQLLMGWWSSDNLGKIRNSKSNSHSSDRDNDLLIAGSYGVYHQPQEAVDGRARTSGDASYQPCHDSAGAVAGEQLHQAAHADQEAVRPPQSQLSHQFFVSPESPAVLNQPYPDPAVQRLGAVALLASQARPPCLDHGGSGACAKCSMM